MCYSCMQPLKATSYHNTFASSVCTSTRAVDVSNDMIRSTVQCQSMGRRTTTTALPLSWITGIRLVDSAALAALPLALDRRNPVRRQLRSVGVTTEAR